MTTYNKTMFESIREALSKDESKNKFGELLKDFLRPEPGNTYLLRLLPNVSDPSKTFFHYYNFGWKSFLNGSNVNVTSLTTWNQPDPIAEERFRVYNTGTEAEKDKIKAVRRSENWLVNVYVISDSKTPTNDGTVKILRFGKQLGKIIFDAIEGDSSDEFGPRVFDLGPDGCSLVVKVEKQGDYPVYTASKFKMPKAIDGMTTEKAEQIYKSTFDLTKYVVSKSYSELKDTLETHYHCKNSAAESVTTVSATPGSDAVANSASSDAVDDETIKNLLGDLK